MTNRVFESMTRVVHRTDRWGKAVIRVWRDEPACTLGPDPEVIAHLDMIRWPLPIDSFAAYGEAIIQHLMTLPRVAAIEVLNEDGNGGLLYPDWS